MTVGILTYLGYQGRKSDQANARRDDALAEQDRALSKQSQALAIVIAGQQPILDRISILEQHDLSLVQSTSALTATMAAHTQWHERGAGSYRPTPGGR